MDKEMNQMEQVESSELKLSIHQPPTLLSTQYGPYNNKSSVCYSHLL